MPICYDWSRTSWPSHDDYSPKKNLRLKYFLFSCLAPPNTGVLHGQLWSYYWHVYVLGPTYFVWPWKPSEPHRTIRDVTPKSLSTTDTCIVYHVSHFEASRNFILHTRYVSTCVGAGCGRGRGTKNKNYPLWSMLFLTYDMYKSSLRHTHDPVLSSLKMKGILLLFSDNLCLQ
jgi:hypothetical protein